MYLPYTQVHIPPIPDPEFAGKTKRGNCADILTQMDDFTGMILDKLDELGLADDTIVVWASDNGADTDVPDAGDRPGPGGRSVEWLLGTLAGRPVHLARGVEPDALHHPLAGEGARRQGQQRARARGRLVHTLLDAAGARFPTTGRSTAWTCATSCSATPRSPGATRSCASRGTGCRP